jgi:rhodanese-related sulfurtransferase
MSNVLATPAALPTIAAAHFAGKLAFETDVSDVHADLEAGVPGIVVIDSRGLAAWEQGRVPGAIHLPTADIPARAAELLPPGVTVVTYCWGPGCNGSTRAALALALLGYQVKEMIGGYEYWVREGLAVETDAGLSRRPADDLTTPLRSVTCAC